MNKNTLIAVVVFAALVAGGIYVLTREKSKGISRITLAAVDTNAIDALELTGKNAAKLVKKDNVWSVETATGTKLADESMVKRVLEAIPKVVSSDLVTNTSANFGEYEVDDEKGTRVKALAGGKAVAEFVLGKGAKGGSHIRVGDEVYAVSGIYSSTFARPSAEWIDKKVLADKIEEVTKVTLALAGKAPYTLVKTGEEWSVEGDVLPKGFRFDASAAKRIVTSLVNLRAKDVLDTDPGVDTTGLEGMLRDVVTYVVKSGETETTREVVLGAVKDGAVYVRVTGRPDVYTVYESTVNTIKKQPQELRDMAMVKLDTAKVVKLAVVDGAKKVSLEKKGSDWSVVSASDKIPADFALDPAAVTRRLSAIANARGTEVASVAAGAAGLGAATVTAQLEDGSKVVLSFGKQVKEKDKEIVYARGNIDDAIYVVTPYMKQNLTGVLDSFKKRADEGGGDGIAGLDPKALSGLPPDVRAQLEQQINQKKREQEMLKKLQEQARPQ
jgi:hypothetical protein